MNVRDLMSEPAVVCRPEESLELAVDRMRDYDVGVLAVIDEDDRIVGVLTDRDACFVACDTGRKLEHIHVRAAMSAPALVCDPDDPVATAESIMQKNHVRRLPVVDPTGRVLGILSLDDLAIEALRELDAGFSPPEISAEQVARTLAEVSKPAFRGNRPMPPGSEAMPRPT